MNHKLPCGRVPNEKMVKIKVNNIVQSIVENAKNLNDRGARKNNFLGELFLSKYTSIICCWKAFRMRNSVLELISIVLRYVERSFHGKDARKIFS